MKVMLIDHGAGNVPSVERALQRLNVQPERATTPGAIESAEALILPGVGHFSALIRALDESGLRAPLRLALDRDVPFLGICLGLQALYHSSEEAPDLRGLQFLSGQISALPGSVKLPHMGWNQVHAERDSRLLQGLAPSAHFYFAHSYAAVANGDADTTATCEHGVRFVAAVERRNICAVQFHPEKSGEAGAQVLRNFLRLAA